MDWIIVTSEISHQEKSGMIRDGESDNDIGIFSKGFIFKFQIQQYATIS